MVPVISASLLCRLFFQQLCAAYRVEDPAWAGKGCLFGCLFGRQFTALHAPAHQFDKIGADLRMAAHGDNG